MGGVCRIDNTGQHSSCSTAGCVRDQDTIMDDLEPQYEYSATGFPVPRPIQYFAIAFRSPDVLRLVNVDQHIASCVQEKVVIILVMLSLEEEMEEEEDGDIPHTRKKHWLFPP